MKNNDYPILVFPKPAKPVERSTLGGGGGRTRVPPVDVTAKRLAPKLSDLVEAIDNGKLNLQQDAEGADPEDVLVLETAGRIDDFYKAVQKIQGFEWLMEEDLEREADDEYYEIDDKGKRKKKDFLSSRLYLVSTNKTALRELVTMYHRYVENPDTDFDLGYAKFKDVFAQLRDVRFWDYRDRLDGSDFLEEWLRNYEAFPEKSIKFQIELWFRSSPVVRNKVQGEVRALVESSGGKVLSWCVLPEIRYHALMVEVSAPSLRQIVDNVEEGSLIKSRDIMFFKALPQSIANPIELQELIPVAGADSPLPIGEPVVALLDGYPMAHHLLLDGRLKIDDPDGFDGKYLVEQRKHGTEMASLIIHGDLSRNEPAIDTPLYVRPIMLPDSRGNEHMPEDRLAVDLVHQAIKRMMEGERGNAPTAPGVKIVNFSIGDPIRVFHHTMSPMARLLDWLSYKYEILFIISAGNCSPKFEIDCDFATFKAKWQNDKSKFFTRELIKKRTVNRIIAPAESINNITVGSTHSDASVFQKFERRINPYIGLFPAIYSPFGGGMKSAVKPDLVFDGGRQMIDECLVEAGVLTPSNYRISPGIQVAAPDSSRDKKIFDRGTSFSTALVSRHAYNCFKTLRELLYNNGRDESHIHLLVKAMTVHGCSWDVIGRNIEQFLPPVKDRREANSLKMKWIGFGYPNLDKSLICTPQRVTVLGYGELKSGKAHIYYLPLPEFLQGKKVKRRLTVTLAWMSPIAPQNQKYRRARMWFETTDHSEIADLRKDVTDYQAVRRGTLQHEVFEDEKRYPYDENAQLGIKVNCADDAGGFDDEIKYALAVTLELGMGEQLELFTENIYEEIRQRLSVPVPVVVNT